MQGMEATRKLSARFNRRALHVASHRPALKLVMALGVLTAALGLMAQYRGSALWWDPSNGDSMQVVTTYEDKTGELMVYNADGPIATSRHPFFQNMGSNGRACVTCHQPSAAMSLTPDRVQERYLESDGKDPVFAAVDGSNCPSLPQDQYDSHSLLLLRGLFRIAMPWPAKGVEPEFTIEVVRDPTGCNTSPVYGIHSAHPAVSVYRRPRMVANLKYVLDSEHAFDPANPATGALAADGRDPSLEDQANDAMLAHEQIHGQLSKADIAEILDFESQIYVAQNLDEHAGDLAEVDGPQALGAWNLGRTKVFSDAPKGPVFIGVADWKNWPRKNAESGFRASVARGAEIFQSRAFVMNDVAGIAPQTAGTCATCHTGTLVGSNRLQTAMDVGTTEPAHAADFSKNTSNELPLFKITCKAGVAPHPYLGRVIYTSDPGRALVTGKCADVGKIVTQQLRGLSARAPYFANGSAQTLEDVVDFYNRRFAMNLTPAEKSDLVNFLGVL